MSSVRRLRNRFRKQGAKDDGGMELQITSLADILMIVLIFLLKSFSSGLTDGRAIEFSRQIALPKVTAGGIGREGLKVEITQDRVEMGGRAVASLTSFRFLPGDLNADLEESSTSTALNQAFARERRAAQSAPAKPAARDGVALVSAKQDESEQEAEEEGFSMDTVWIVADRRAPYATIQTVIASAAMQGYSDFKLAVVQGE